MDFSALINTIKTVACVMSVEKLPEDNIGEVRIVAANKAYKESMPGYYDNMPYTELFPKERKFEHFLAMAALENKQIHTYVDAKGVGMWMDQVYIPLESDKENVGYCIFSYEMTKEADPDRIGNVSMDTAASVIKSCAVFRTADSFKVAVSEVVKELLDKCGAEKVSVVSIDELSQKLKYIGGISKNQTEAERERNIEDLSIEMVKSWDKTIERSNGLIIADDADMKSLEERNPQWAKSLQDNGVKSICFFPLYQNKLTIGYIYVVNFDTTRTIEIKELIEHTSFFLAAELANNTLMEKMKELSNVDTLTGVFNRNAMNLRVDEFVTKPELRLKPYGVIFIDLNGLKYVNDKYGHEAGDQMLWSAASIISSIFGDDEIYRAGGDEFTIICTKNSESEFDEKIKQLREQTSYPAEITMSIGHHFSKSGGDIRFAMRDADLAMYKDKEEFYKAHPELKSRKI